MCNCIRVPYLFKFTLLPNTAPNAGKWSNDTLAGCSRHFPERWLEAQANPVADIPTTAIFLRDRSGIAPFVILDPITPTKKGIRRFMLNKG